MAIAPVPFACTVKPDREIVVVALSGELDIATAPEAARAINELIEAGFTRVTVDLAGLTFIDSTGLRMLLEASRSAAERDCVFTLVPGPDDVQRAFELTNLHSHFTFEYPSARFQRLPPSPGDRTLSRDRLHARANEAAVRDWLRRL